MMTCPAMSESSHTVVGQSPVSEKEKTGKLCAGLYLIFSQSVVLIAHKCSCSGGVLVSGIVSHAQRLTVSGC